MLRQGVNSDGETIRDAYVKHDPVDLDCAAAKDGMCRQEFADECDINNVLARYETTGVLNHFNRGEPQYLDVSEVMDLRGNLDLIERARAAFMQLPAVVRREFENDPVQFVEFAQDPGNIDQLRDWGLAKPLPKAADPVQVQVVNANPDYAAAPGKAADKSAKADKA